MKEITFIVTEDNTDGGYNARERWAPGNRDIFTQADTHEELMRNIRDAIDATFDEAEQRPELVHLHFVRDEVIAPVKLPRDVTGNDLIKVLATLGYAKVRQSSSHVRMTTTRNGEHHVTVPMHDPIQLGTLRGILGQVAAHGQMTLDDLLTVLEL